MCQRMPPQLYTRYELDADLQRFKPRQSSSRSFENMVMSYLQRMRPDCRIESFYTEGSRLIVSMQIGFVDIAALCL